LNSQEEFEKNEIKGIMEAELDEALLRFDRAVELWQLRD